MRRAMQEGYGIGEVKLNGSYHRAYATLSSGSGPGASSLLGLA